MTIKTQIAGSPQTTLINNYEVTVSGSTVTLSGAFSVVDGNALPATTGTETNYVTLQEKTSENPRFITIEYTRNGTVITPVQNNPVKEHNLTETHTFTTSDIVFRPFCAQDVSDISDAIAGKASTSHAASHADGGSDEISIDASQVTSGIIDLGQVPTIPLGSKVSGVLPIANGGTSGTSKIYQVTLANGANIADAINNAPICDCITVNLAQNGVYGGFSLSKKPLLIINTNGCKFTSKITINHSNVSFVGNVTIEATPSNNNVFELGFCNVFIQGNINITIINPNSSTAGIFSGDVPCRCSVYGQLSVTGQNGTAGYGIYAGYGAFYHISNPSIISTNVTTSAFVSGGFVLLGGAKIINNAFSS